MRDHLEHGRDRRNRLRAAAAPAKAMYAQRCLVVVADGAGEDGFENPAVVETEN